MIGPARRPNFVRSIAVHANKSDLQQAFSFARALTSSSRGDHPTRDLVLENVGLSYVSPRWCRKAEKRSLQPFSVLGFAVYIQAIFDSDARKPLTCHPLRCP